jgi:uncharacterized protein (TIGR00661 family)
MNIVYGVSGEGLGHVFEAMEIVALLERDGHRVKVLTFGDRACRALARFEPTRIEGVHLGFNAKGLSLWATAKLNYPCLPFYLKHGRRVMRELEEFRPDVFITAYEPFTTLAAHRLGRPLISMDNQNELRFLPRPAGASVFAFNLVKWTTRIVTYGAAEYLVKSFHRGGRRSGRFHFVSPMIQSEIRRLQPTDGAHVLVYLTKPNPPLIAVLRTLPETFIVYCHNRVGEEGNIIHRAQGESYLRDLGSCKAIIGTTGFSLIADSIYLRKPYFGVPLKRQFEQTHNARFLVESGLGEAAEEATAEQIGRFLARLPEYRAKLAAYALDPAEQEETLRALLAGIEARSGAGVAEGGARATSAVV